jgi:thiamine-monophosphate kinase
MASESELISALASIFNKPTPDLIVGIGDDGAVAAPSNKKIVMSTDMAVEGVHFKREWSTLKEIGEKLQQQTLQIFMRWAEFQNISLLVLGYLKE